MANNIIKMPMIEDKEAFLDGFAEQAMEADHIMVCAKMPNGEVVTGYWEVPFGMRAELIGHMQCDLIDSMILANIGDRY